MYKTMVRRRFPSGHRRALLTDRNVELLTVSFTLDLYHQTVHGLVID